MTDMSANPESALTPNRETTATFDLTETVLVEEPWGAIRTFGEVAPIAAATKGADSRFSNNMHFWACGAWGLRPIQFDVSHMEKDFPDLVFQKAEF